MFMSTQLVRILIASMLYNMHLHVCACLMIESGHNRSESNTHTAHLESNRQVDQITQTQITQTLIMYHIAPTFVFLFVSYTINCSMTGYAIAVRQHMVNESTPLSMQNALYKMKCTPIYEQDALLTNLIWASQLHWLKHGRPYTRSEYKHIFGQAKQLQLASKNVAAQIQMSLSKSYTGSAHRSSSFFISLVVRILFGAIIGLNLPTTFHDGFPLHSRFHIVDIFIFLFASRVFVDC